jgi:hypothetical protein
MPPEASSGVPGNGRANDVRVSQIALRLLAEPEFRSLRSILTARAELSSAAGKTFGGERNVDEALGYKAALEVEDYRNRYKRNPIAARVIEAFPRGTWRGAGELIEDEDPNKITDFEHEWGLFATRLKVWPTLLRADILAGLGRYAIVLLGAPGVLSSPLKKSLRSTDIAYLATYAEDNAKILEFEKDLGNPRFGRPIFYEISKMVPEATGTLAAEAKSKVHWSRVIHVADGMLEDNVYGQPRLERVWNRLDDLDKIVGAGAEAFWLRAHQGYQFDLDKEMELTAAAEQDLKDEVDEFINGLRRAVRTRGMKLTTLGSDVATFDRNVESVIGQIAAGTGIPQRILMGSERGQLASQQDRVNWAERVQDRRVEYAGPLVVGQLVDRLIEHGALPTPTEYDIRWPAIFDLSDEEKATIGVKWAEINSKMKKTVILPNEFRDRLWGWSPITDAEMIPLEVAKPAKALENAE